MTTSNSDSNPSPYTYTLCGRGGSCCPVVTQTAPDEFTITDDHGGSVRLTTEQLQLMQTVINHTQTPRS